MKYLATTILAFAFSAELTGCATTTYTKTPTNPQEQLTRAAEQGDEALVSKLLAEGVEPGGEGTSDAISWAQAKGHTQIFNMLIDRCLQIYMAGRNCASLPRWVAGDGHIDRLASFLDKSGDANLEVDESSMLAIAAGAGHLANAKLLVSRGADIDAAVQQFEDSIGILSGLGSAGADKIPSAKAAIALLERLRPKQTAPGGISKAEMAEMMKAAVASAQPVPTPKPVADVFRSDVDVPSYKVTPNPDAYAFVVGVEKYNTLPEARFAERDAKAMSAHLLAMGYPQRNIILLTGAQATKTGMIKNLEAWLPNNVTDRSSVFFYFSGHGAPDANTSKAYLVPADGDPQYLEETAYPLARLYEKLQALKAKRVVVALDSCFSGAGGRSVLAQGTRPLVGKLKAPAAGRIVSMSASASDEITGTAEDQGHGLFTYQLLKALSETSGRGTVAELYDALKPRVQDDARRQNRGQTPQLSGSAVDTGLR